MKVLKLSLLFNNLLNQINLIRAFNRALEGRDSLTPLGGMEVQTHQNSKLVWRLTSWRWDTPSLLNVLFSIRNWVGQIPVPKMPFSQCLVTNGDSLGISLSLKSLLRVRSTLPVYWQLREQNSELRTKSQRLETEGACGHPEALAWPTPTPIHPDVCQASGPGSWEMGEGDW